MSDTEIRMMRYTIEQLSEELRATKQYMSDTESKLERTKKQLEIAVDALKEIDETRSGVKENLHATNGRTLNAGNGFCWATIDDIHNTLKEINNIDKGELDNAETHI